MHRSCLNIVIIIIIMVPSFASLQWLLGILLVISFVLFRKTFGASVMAPSGDVAPTSTDSQQPILVVVSYDAFRYDYMERSDISVPHMRAMRSIGTWTDYMTNVFPTKTFPNHHSIATGLYPEEHGVIGNHYFDAATKTDVNISRYEFYHYNEAIMPIWRLNEAVVDKRRRHSGVMMWPGGDYTYQNQNVTHNQRFNTNIDYFKRVDTMISWMLDPEKPANLIMLYIEEPDSHGHGYGPNAPIILNDILRKLDNLTQYLEDKLQEFGLADRTTVIHLSDHGLATVRPPHFLNITQFLKAGTYNMVGVSPVLQIIPNSREAEDEIYENLKKVELNGGHFKVYQKAEIPDRWRYKNCNRTPPILVVADEGYALDDIFQSVQWYAKVNHYNITNSSEFGIHGYDYTMKEMRPFFMIRGPRIKINYKVPPFHTVDLFSLFCEILEIPAEKIPKNSGNPQRIQEIFMSASNYPTNGVLLYILVGVIIMILLVIALVLYRVFNKFGRNRLKMCKLRVTNVIRGQHSRNHCGALHVIHMERQHLLQPSE